MPEWLKAGLIILAVAEFGIALITIFMVYSLSRKGLRLLPAPATFARQIEATRNCDLWARRHGLAPVGSFVMNSGPRVLIRAWEDVERQRVFAMYYSDKGPVHDLVTAFSSGVALTTGNSGGGGLFPRPPGDLAQIFPKVDLEDLWQRHCDAEQYLRTFCHLRPRDTVVPFEERMPAAIRESMLYVRTLTLWPLRALYWFAIRRFRWQSVSIQQQFERGLVRLP